jgi:hypothetical protein
MMKLVPISLIASCMLAAPTFAADAPPTAAQADQTKSELSAKDEPKEKLICKRETPVGSTIPKRTCRTMAQIEQDRRDAQKIRERVQPVGR